MLTYQQYTMLDNIFEDLRPEAAELVAAVFRHGQQLVPAPAFLTEFLYQPIRLIWPEVYLRPWRAHARVKVVCCSLLFGVDVLLVFFSCGFFVFMYCCCYTYIYIYIHTYMLLLIMINR